MNINSPHTVLLPYTKIPVTPPAFLDEPGGSGRISRPVIKYVTKPEGWPTLTGFPDNNVAATRLTEEENDATDLLYDKAYVARNLGQAALPDVRASDQLSGQTHHTKAA